MRASVKHVTYTAASAILLLCASCADSYIPNDIRIPEILDGNEPEGDSTCIRLNMEDTVMEEEIEEIHYQAEEWIESDMSADL